MAGSGPETEACAGRPLAERLPALYARLFPELVATEAPVEALATCRNCAMAAGDDVRPGALYFAADAKCCTYHPSVPNYLAGALLADADPHLAEGRRRVRERIARRSGISPLGLEPPGDQAQRYERLMPRLFGRVRALRCTFFDTDGGGCTIWPFREATCSTYHCKFVHGADGRAYWDALKGVLGQIQADLSLLAMHRLGIAADRAPGRHACEPSAEELDGEPAPEARHRAAFGEWSGREEEYYRRCFEVVSALDPAEARAACGIRLTVREAALAACRDTIAAPSLPDPLLRNPRLETWPGPDGTVTVVGFSGNQPVRLRREVLRLLDDFDGRTPTADVLAGIVSREGLTLSPGLLLRLWQQRLLIAPDALAES